MIDFQKVEKSLKQYLGQYDRNNRRNKKLCK